MRIDSNLIINLVLSICLFFYVTVFSFSFSFCFATANVMYFSVFPSKNWNHLFFKLSYEEMIIINLIYCARLQEFFLMICVLNCKEHVMHLYIYLGDDSYHKILYNFHYYETQFFFFCICDRIFIYDIAFNLLLLAVSPPFFHNWFFVVGCCLRSLQNFSIVIKVTFCLLQCIFHCTNNEVFH